MQTKIIEAVLASVTKSRLPSCLPMPLWDAAWRVVHAPTLQRSMHATNACSKYKRVKPGKVPHPDKCRKRRKPMKPICMAERRVDLPATDPIKNVCRKVRRRSMCSSKCNKASNRSRKCDRRSED